MRGTDWMAAEGSEHFDVEIAPFALHDDTRFTNFSFDDLYDLTI